MEDGKIQDQICGRFMLIRSEIFDGYKDESGEVWRLYQKKVDSPPDVGKAVRTCAIRMSFRRKRLFSEWDLLHKFCTKPVSHEQFQKQAWNLQFNLNGINSDNLLYTTPIFAFKVKNRSLRCTHMENRKPAGGLTI